MHRLLTALGRGFKERIGWKRLGIAASLLIITLAITTLVRTLKGVNTGVILGCAHRNPAGPYRARGVLRHRGILHPDVL